MPGRRSRTRAKDRCRRGEVWGGIGADAAEQSQRSLSEERGEGKCRRSGRGAEKGTLVEVGRWKRILAQRPRSRTKDRGRRSEVEVGAGTNVEKFG